MFHPNRKLKNPRTRKSNIHFTNNSTNKLSSSQNSYSPNNKKTINPITNKLISR